MKNSDLAQEVAYWESELKSAKDIDFRCRFDFFNWSDEQFEWMLQRMGDLVKEIPSASFLDALVKCLGDVHDDAGTRQTIILRFLQLCGEIDAKYCERVPLEIKVTLARRFGILLQNKTEDLPTEGRGLWPSPYTTTQLLTSKCWKSWTQETTAKDLFQWEVDFKSCLQSFMDHHRESFLTERHPHPDLITIFKAGEKVFPRELFEPRIRDCFETFIKEPGGSGNENWYQARSAYIRYTARVLSVIEEKTSPELLWMGFESKWKDYIKEKKDFIVKYRENDDLPLFSKFKEEKDAYAKRQKEFEELQRQERLAREALLDFPVKERMQKLFGKKFKVPIGGVLSTKSTNNYYKVSLHHVYNCDNHVNTFRIEYNNDQKRINSMDEEVWELLQEVVQRSNQAAKKMQEVHFVRVWISLKGRLGPRLKFLLSESVVACVKQGHCYDAQWVPFKLKTEKSGWLIQEKLRVPELEKKEHQHHFAWAVHVLDDGEGKQVRVQILANREATLEEDKVLQNTLTFLMERKQDDILVSTNPLGFAHFGDRLLDMLQTHGFRLLDGQWENAHVWRKGRGIK